MPLRATIWPKADGRGVSRAWPADPLPPSRDSPLCMCEDGTSGSGRPKVFPLQAEHPSVTETKEKDSRVHGPGPLPSVSSQSRKGLLPPSPQHFTSTRSIHQGCTPATPADSRLSRRKTSNRTCAPPAPHPAPEGLSAHSPLAPPSSPGSEYFEVNPRPHGISAENISAWVSKKLTFIAVVNTLL